MHKHDVAYCHTLQTLIFWPLCLSEDCRKNEKKSSQTKREKGTNDTKVPLQGVISPHMHESCPLADSISRSIFQLFHIHEGFKTIPRNDTKTIPISDPFCVSETMTHVYRVQHRVFFWCFPQVPRKSTPSSKLFSLEKTIWGRSYFRRSYSQKDSTTTLTYHDQRTLYFHIGIINLIQTLKNDGVHKKKRYPTLNVPSVN